MPDWHVSKHGPFLFAPQLIGAYSIQRSDGLGHVIYFPVQRSVATSDVHKGLTKDGRAVSDGRW